VKISCDEAIDDLSLFRAARCCSALRAAVPRCALLFRAARCCSALRAAVPRCALLFRAARCCSALFRSNSFR